MDALRAGATVFATALGVDFFTGAVADVAVAAFDQILGELVELVEIIGSVGDLVGLEAEPFNDVENGSEVLFFLCGGVGVVVTEVAFAAVITGETKVYGNGLGVTNVEITIGLDRSSG